MSRKKPLSQDPRFQNGTFPVFKKKRGWITDSFFAVACGAKYQHHGNISAAQRALWAFEHLSLEMSGSRCSVLLI